MHTIVKQFDMTVLGDIDHSANGHKGELLSTDAFFTKILSVFWFSKMSPQAVYGFMQRRDAD